VFFGVGDAYGLKSDLNEDDARYFGTQSSKIDWRREPTSDLEMWRRKGNVFIHEKYDLYHEYS